MTTAKHPPNVSVILPVFRSEHTLADAIESVQHQTMALFELIIISEHRNSARSTHIAESYAVKDERIRLIRNDQYLGFVESVNLGIKLARGKYIARLDADDMYTESALATLFNFMEDRPDVSFCYARQRFSTGELTPSVNSHEDIKAGLLLNWVINHPYFWRREDFLKHDFFFDPSQPMEDYALMAKAIRVINFAYIPKILYIYQVNPVSITKTKINALTVNTRQIISDNLEYALGIKIPEADKFLFQLWRNPFEWLENHSKRDGQKKLLAYFDRIIKKNKEVKYCDQRSLWRALGLKSLNSLGRPLPLSFGLQGKPSSKFDTLRSALTRMTQLGFFSSWLKMQLRYLAFEGLRPFWRLFYKYFRPYLANILQAHLEPLQFRIDEIENLLRNDSSPAENHQTEKSDKSHDDAERCSWP